MSLSLILRFVVSLSIIGSFVAFMLVNRTVVKIIFHHYLLVGILCRGATSIECSSGPPDYHKSGASEFDYPVFFNFIPVGE